MNIISVLLRPALLLASVSVLPAYAAPITITGYAAAGPTTTVRLTNASPARSVYAHAGGFLTTEGTSNPFVSWCVDIFQNALIGQTVNDYTRVDSATFFALQPSKADMLGRLATLAHDDALTSSVKAGAFQLAIWEIVNETGSTLDVFSGNFWTSRASDGSQAQAQDWLSRLPVESRYTFDVLASPTRQDVAVFERLPMSLQAANGVPEPGTFALGLLGMGVLAAVRRRAAGRDLSSACA